LLGILVAERYMKDHVGKVI